MVFYCRGIMLDHFITMITIKEPLILYFFNQLRYQISRYFLDSVVKKNKTKQKKNSGFSFIYLSYFEISNPRPLVLSRVFYTMVTCLCVAYSGKKKYVKYSCHYWELHNILMLIHDHYYIKLLCKYVHM